MNAHTNQFSVGDAVTWKSQAQGSTVTKRGIVVAIIPPGERPNRMDFVQLYKGGCGWGRPGESYVVKVGNKLYWPHTKNLRHAVDPVEAARAAESSEVAELRADRDSWMEQANARVKDWDDMRRRAQAAEFRISELEVIARALADGYGGSVLTNEVFCLHYELREQAVKAHELLTNLIDAVNVQKATP